MLQRLYGPADFATTTWSGGTTTQLFLWPPKASYANRDFSLRLSTARVEAETSNFTSLPGVRRQLMLLEGAITLEHEERYMRELRPFELECFDGDWITTATGTCTDFNLMCMGEAEGELASILLRGDSVEALRLAAPWQSLLLYAHQGEALVETPAGASLLPQGHLILLSDNAVRDFRLHTENSCRLLVVKANLLLCELGHKSTE